MPQQFSLTEVFSFMKRTALMSASFCTENKPYTAILLFAVDDSHHMYFATLKSSTKVSIIEQNNAISFAVWEHKQMLVQAAGTVTALTDPEKIEQTVEMMADAAHSLPNFWPPVLQISNHEYVVYRVTIDELRAMDLSSPHLVEKETLFTHFKEI